MENDKTLTFNVSRIGHNICRITANHIMDDIKAIADGACICDLEVMLDEMEHIKEECKRRNMEARFDFI